MQQVLFDLIRRRRELPPEEQYVLFLGAGASISSGGPLFTALFEAVNTDSYDSFSEVVENLSDSERFALFRPMLELRQPSPEMVQLGKLVREGYFSLILTTNFDTLIERALQAAGLGPEDYLVLVNDASDSSTGMTSLLACAHPRIKLVKLHGDLMRRNFALSRTETLEFSSSVQSELERIFATRDAILVGTQFSDLDVLRCVPGKGGSLWSVNPTAPHSDLLALMKKRRCQRNVLAGSSGEFDCFVSQLAESIDSAPTQTFALNWYVLCPFTTGVPASVLPHFEELELGDVCRGLRWAQCRTPKGDSSVQIAFTEFGTAVCVRQIRGTYRSICEFAQVRAQLYQQLLYSDSAERVLVDSINQQCSALDSSAKQVQKSLGYALSLVFVEESGWKSEAIGHAIALLSCPSALRTESEIVDPDDEYGDVRAAYDIRLERQYLDLGIQMDELERFTVPGVLQGGASWAGIAAYIRGAHRQKTVQSFLEYETCVQGLWWYTCQGSELLNKGAITVLCSDAYVKAARRCMSTIMRIGPTESTTTRLFREAVLRTCRIERLWHDYCSILKEEQP